MVVSMSSLWVMYEIIILWCELIGMVPEGWQMSWMREYVDFHGYKFACDHKF